MILGLWVIIGLFIWMCGEVTILLFSNKKLVLSWFDKKEGEDITLESREYNIRALTLSGLTFAGIALLINAFSNNIQEAVDTIIILVFSFGLFLCSYKIEVLTNYRLYWIMQEKCLNFGFLGLISSLVVFFYIEGITIILAAFCVFFGVIIIIHLIELTLDFKYYSERAAPKKNKI